MAVNRPPTATDKLTPITSASRFPRPRRLLAGGLAASLAIVALAFGAAYGYGGAYAINVLLHRSVMLWMSIAPDDPRLSPSMRLALGDHAVHATPGALDWR